MLKGTFFHTIDDNGRIGIPNKLRVLIEKVNGREILILTQGFEGCIFAYPYSEWQKIEEKAANLSLLDEDARNFIRFFIAPASECSLDKLGRIVIPANLREYAGIKKDVVLCGAVNKIEIWAKEKWEAFWKEFKSSQKDIISRMKNIGL